MTTSHSKRPRLRGLATVATGAMILAMFPAGAAAAEARSTDDVCPPPGEDEEQQFDDADKSQTHERHINCVAQYGIAQGVTLDEYRPLEDVRRDQMATFITNLIETATDRELDAGDDDAFDDIDGNTHQQAINKLANAGVVIGTGDSQYSPNDNVRRDSMATFIARAIDYAHNEDIDTSRPPDAGEEPHFDDVAETNTHVENINRLAEQDIVVGTGGGDYSPHEDVSRAQMATFIMRSADYLHEIGHFVPTFTPTEQSYAVAMSWLNEVEDGVFAQGDPDATGSADLVYSTQASGWGSVTIDFAGEGLSSGPQDIGDFGPLHLHVGDLDENGPVVLPFLDAATEVDWDEQAGEASAEASVTLDNATILDILDAPDSYYVNYHTEDHADPGAIRGQLPDGGQDAVAGHVASFTTEPTDVSQGEQFDPTVEVAVGSELAAHLEGETVELDGTGELEGQLTGDTEVVVDSDGVATFTDVGVAADAALGTQTLEATGDFGVVTSTEFTVEAD